MDERINYSRVKGLLGNSKGKIKFFQNSNQSLLEQLYQINRVAGPK